MPQLSRREFLRAAGAAGAGGLAGTLGLPAALLDVAAAPACGSLSDVEHVVVFIQENRSFDHYFGTLAGVRGFGDPRVLRQPDGLPVFAQPGYAPGRNPDGHLLPFHLDTATGNAECTNDITHEWGAQHQSWNGGRMDSFVRAHLAADPANGPLTMGYYTRDDLPFYHALADAFTICDGYHCSVIGPTDPNRLYTVTATLDPAGAGGGPQLTTLVGSRPQKFGAFTWTTYPERLSAAGVSWKVYGTPDGTYGDNVLVYFRQYYTNPALAANAFAPQFPQDFLADCAAGTLPQVSWIIGPLLQSEHPPAPPEYGEMTVAQVLQALTANPDVWRKTVLFVTYDENGGFFDHVPPPVAPPGTPGEYLTVNPLPAAADGIAGPIGLGFRVPMLVVSPFSRGGLVCSETFDHTSTLRFMETRFGVEVPNLSAWRRSVTGDLTAALNLAHPDTTVPVLPPTSPADPVVLRECIPSAVISEGSNGTANPLVPTYPVPPNSWPQQEPGGRRPTPSGPGCPPGQGAGAPAAGPAGAVLGASSVGSTAALPFTTAPGLPSAPSVVAGAALAGLAWVARRRRRAGPGGAGE